MGNTFNDFTQNVSLKRDIALFMKVCEVLVQHSIWHGGPYKNKQVAMVALWGWLDGKGKNAFKFFFSTLTKFNESLNKNLKGVNLEAWIEYSTVEGLNKTLNI